MRKRNRTKTVMLLAAMTLCATLSLSTLAQAASTIHFGNQTRAEDFRPYIGDKWGSNHVTNESTKAKVLLFFRRNCSVSIDAVKSMAKSSYLNDSEVEIELIDCSSSSWEQISSMIQSYRLDKVKDRIYYSPTSYPNSTAMWYYVSDYPELNLEVQSYIVPVTIILDGNNDIRYAKNNFFSLSEVDEIIGILLEEQKDPEETLPEETTPAETAPEETLPEETLPEETLPEETAPEETLPEETTPEETTPETESPEETEAVRNTVTLYFMTGSTPADPGEVFAQYEVPKNSRGNTTTINKTIGSGKPEKEGYTFSHWNEGDLKDSSRIGGKVSSIIWTNESDQYIYAQYNKNVTLYFMTGSSPEEPGEVFAEFEVPVNSRGNTTTIANTIKTAVPSKADGKFSHWREAKLSDPNVLGNKVGGVIWTNETDQYIYAQYK